MSTLAQASGRFGSLWADKHVNRLVIILATLLVFFALVRTSNFFNPATWQSMAVQFPEFGLMALGVMLTMILGGIDLSVVAVANLSSIAAAIMLTTLIPANASLTEAVFGMSAAILAALVIGVLVGVINGVFISVVGIPPILATLGTFELFTGIAIVLTDGKAISRLPAQYGDIFAARLFGVIPVPIIVFTLTVLLIAFILYKTSYGAKIYLLGTNPLAAHFSGLNTHALQIRTYLISGFCASLAGLVMLANYNSARADYGSSYTLLAILIVVLGGINPNGGSGGIWGVILAIVTLQIMSSLLNTFPEVSNFYRSLIWGAVLLLVIVMNGWAKHMSLKRLLLIFRNRK